MSYDHARNPPGKPSPRGHSSKEYLPNSPETRYKKQFSSAPGNLRIGAAGNLSVSRPIRCAAFYWYFRWLRRDTKAGAETKVLLALPELELCRGAACPDRRLDGSHLGVPFPIGNVDMTRPAMGLLAAVDQLNYGVLAVARPVAVVASKGVIPEFMRCYCRPHRSRLAGLTHNLVARPSLSHGVTPSGHAACRPTSFFSNSPSHPLCDAPLRRPHLAPASGPRTLAGGTGPLRVAPERVSHGQQNAYRRVAPRRNQSGRPPR